MQQMLAPLGKQSPYYAINVNAADGSWTAKFVFIAANAWDSNQSSWLQGVMAQQTTYTFVMRHEPSAASSPGTGPSDQIINQFSYTMLITGHTHTFSYRGSNYVVIGNGGAPVTGGVNYGYVIAQQRSDGAIVFTAKDYQSLQTVQTFAVTAKGTPTQ
jgi:hypothetical protein